MSAGTQTQTSPTPEYSILTRVASIPMIHKSLNTINDTLIANAYTRSPYTTAKGLSTSAYKLSEPLQIRLAPIINYADGYANKAVDVVESRYPYPFKAQPEEVASYVRERRESATAYVKERRESAVNVANKTIDEKVKSPAFNVAQGIDQRFAPIVDYFEEAVTRLNHNNAEAGPSSPDTQYQYQRALALSKNLTDSIYHYSNDQVKQLQAQSVLVQRATETAQSITALATSSLANAQARIHALSDTMLSELQKLQASTAALQNSLASSTMQIPANLQSSLHQSLQSHPQLAAAYDDLSTSLTSTVNDLTEIITAKDVTVNEKAQRVGIEVKERVSPLLEIVAKRVGEVVDAIRGRGEQAKKETVNGVNGVANGH